MAEYKLKPYQSFLAGPRQEVVIGRITIEGQEYVAIRDRVPGSDDTTGILLPADSFEQFIEICSKLEAFMHGGSREPGPGQGSLL